MCVIVHYSLIRFFAQYLWGLDSSLACCFCKKRTKENTSSILKSSEKVDNYSHKY